MVAARPSQSDALPAGQCPDFWRDVQDQILPYGSDWSTAFEIPYDDVSVYASTIQPVAESSLKVARSFFGPATPESSDVDHSKIMMSLLPQLEVGVPEFSTEEFKQKWEMLSWSSHDNTILHFFEFAVCLSSNNMLESDQTNAVLQWLIDGGNQLRLDALVSSGMPTAMAFIHEIFKCALRNRHLHVARALFETGIDFSEVLQSSQQILKEALCKNDVELTQFFLEGGVDAKLFTGILRYAKRVETAQLLLKAGVDVNELDDAWYGFPSTALGKAVMDRNFELAEFLIKEGADVNLAEETEYDGERTPLRAAVETGDVGLVKLLLDKGAEVDASSCRWEGQFEYHCATPLQVAAASGDVKLATLLLRSGADVNAPGYEMSALHWAVKSGSIEMVRFLLNHHADPNTPAENEHRSTAIQIAAEHGNTDAIQILLAAGAINNSADQCHLRGQLRQAIRDGYIDRARAILRLDIDVSKPFSDQSTILQEAIFIDDPGMVQLLVEAGVDVNISCRSYQDPESTVTPLQLTLEFMDEEFDTPHSNAAQIAKVLLKASAEPNPPNHTFGTSTPLQFAVARGEQAQAYELVQLLLIAGASVNAPASGNLVMQTALQLAVQHWNISTGFDLLQLLLKYGADVNAPACSGYRGGTALQIAVRIGDIDLIRFLLKAGANVNTPAGNSFGRTALQEAVKVGDLDLIRFLLENCADVNSPAGHAYGRTALQQAIEMEGSKSRLQAENSLEEQRLKVVKLLMKEGAKINAPPAVIGGRTALQAAAAATTKNSSIKLMQDLLDAGADVNASAGAEKGLTALQGAAICGHMKFALMLLERDADVNAPGSTIDGRTALEGAAEHGRLDMVQILINVGADSHLPGRQRYRSAARFAAKEGHVAVANLLKDRFEE